MDFEFRRRERSNDAPGRPPSAREEILDAAEGCVCREGALSATHLACASDRPRAAVLYHYPDDASVALALVLRGLERTDRALELEASLDTENRGRWSRAYLAAVRPTEGGELAGEATGPELIAATLAAVGPQPALLAKIHEQFQRWHERMNRDGLEPKVVTLMHLVGDGLWLQTLLGTPGPEPADRDRALEWLRGVTLKRRTQSVAPPPLNQSPLTQSSPSADPGRGGWLR